MQAWKPATLLRTDSNKEVFSWNLQNFWEHLFYITPPVATFETKHMLQLPFYIRIWNLAWNESHDKKTKHIHASAADLLHIRIGKLNWLKYGYCQNESRELDCLYRREVNAMLIASAKIPEREGSISSCRCYGYLPDC